MTQSAAKPSHDPVARIQATGVLPVVVIDDPDLAVPLAEDLLAGGVDLIEITLRRPSAMAALERVARDCPDIVPIAGTVVTPAQVALVKDAGARVVVSPGFSESVDAAMRESGLPWLPGVATASVCMRAVAVCCGRDCPPDGTVFMLLLRSAEPTSCASLPILVSA